MAKLITESIKINFSKAVKASHDGDKVITDEDREQLTALVEELFGEDSQGRVVEIEED